MITELRVHNFRTFINATFRFKRRHLLIGKNTSGKTNLGLALTFPKVIAKMSVADAIAANPGGYLDFCNYAIADKDRNTTFSLKAEIECTECAKTTFSFHYGFTLWTTEPRLLQTAVPPARVLREELSVSGGPFRDTVLLANDGKVVRLLQEDKFRDGHADAYTETQAPHDSTMLAKIYGSQSNHTAVLFRDFLRGMAYFNLSPDRIRTGWVDSRNLGGLESSGANLVQMICAMKTSQETRYRRVLERVRRLEPRLAAINFLGFSPNVVPAVELEGGRPASWGSLSDGTLRALGLSYLLECANPTRSAVPQAPPVYFIEEPENSMFVSELRSLLYDAENVAPLGQMIFTTHSPYFLDLFDDDLDAVTLLDREDWHTTSRSLGERRAEIEAALKTAPLGEQYFRDMLG